MIGDPNEVIVDAYHSYVEDLVLEERRTNRTIVSQEQNCPYNVTTHNLKWMAMKNKISVTHSEILARGRFRIKMNPHNFLHTPHHTK